MSSRRFLRANSARHRRPSGAPAASTALRGIVAIGALLTASILLPPTVSGAVAADAGTNGSTAPTTSTSRTSTNSSSSTSTTTSSSTTTTVQPTVHLGAAGSFSVLASTALTSAGGSDAGASGDSTSANSAQAQSDLTAAYNATAALTPTALIDGDLGGRVITPGIYRAGAALAMTTSLTFDAQGNPNAVFIFQVGAAVNTAAASAMILTNGAQASHVFWQVLGAVTAGASSSFVGTILGNAAITVGANTSFDGRALTKSGAVTVSNTTFLPVPDITISSAVSPSVDVQAGDPVVFSNVITNTGNVDLTLDYSAGLPAGTVSQITWPDSRRALPAGASVRATTPYTPTLADASARSISAIATVTGTPRSAGAVSATSTIALAVYPTPVADSVSTSRGQAVTLNVLANDAGSELGSSFSRAALGASASRLIGGASGPVPGSPAEGSVTCVDSGPDRGSCTYQPASGFIGTDTFDYALSQDTRSWNVRVTILVTPGSAAPTARAVRVVATTGAPAVTFDPNADTPVSPDGTLQIVSVSALPPEQGTLSCSATACTFVPPAGGFTGIATATYTEADVSDAGIVSTTSTPATITIFVDPAPLTVMGFVTAPQTTAPVSIDTWSGSTTVAASSGTCTSGRPSSTISWATSSGSTSWVVQRRVSGAAPGAWITVATLPAATTSYTDTRVGEGQSYQWRVRPDLSRWPGIFSSPSNNSTESVAVNAYGC